MPLPVAGVRQTRCFHVIPVQADRRRFFATVLFNRDVVRSGCRVAIDDDVENVLVAPDFARHRPFRDDVDVWWRRAQRYSRDLQSRPRHCPDTEVTLEPVPRSAQHDVRRRGPRDFIGLIAGVGVPNKSARAGQSPILPAPVQIDLSDCS